ncbi:unnamed protein product [Bursaphelenchus okinawaensis]|uniref:SCP domain-containing protein n=1 Tax=Bursaphelenchus okinawaensis TaxID=465554 RepID=A0A811LTJ1_9BILA|nr:unnamed protein product [Bursaphelenchus okinawaensis]CAG9127717.1 unnamed protein product [Bursaphelenchus okinawaensis]
MLTILIVCLLGYQLEATKFTAEQQQAILKAHNDYRRTLAKGQAKGQNGGTFPAAANMNELVWDTDLETKADQWAQACNFEHPSNPGYGQNLAAASPFSSADDALKSAVDEWWGEGKNYPAGVAFTFGSSTGHFTQVAWAATSKVGCAVQNCTNGQSLFGTSDWTFTVCDYLSPGNYQNQDIYKSGEACSACSGGSCDDGLCKA